MLWSISMIWASSRWPIGPSSARGGRDFTDGQVKGIGALEVLAAIGLIIPAALGVVPILTALAAAGIVLLMLGAARTHLGRGEGQMLPINLVLAAIALFVAIERFGPHS